MRIKLAIGLCALVFVACNKDTQPVAVDFYGSQFFADVQMLPVFPDSKTFVDCTPKRDLAAIIHDYDAQKDSEGFDLKQFVLDNFELPVRPESNFQSDTTRTLEQHITALWSVLTREPDDYHPRSSLIPLPHPYIVPGGRFSEIYYWDSYFTMVGLAQQGRFDMIKNMVDNFTFLIDSIGFIPNGNRNYYLGRSQPPFYAMMVKVLQESDSLAPMHYLPALEKEYNYWMEGADQLQKSGDVKLQVVMLDDGLILNRYIDRIPLPRPEAYKEDYHVASSSDRPKEEVYTNLRAAATSGWDFSSRWFRDGQGLSTIHTIDFIPVDLNSLLYNLEMTIAEGYKQKGETDNATAYEEKASRRAEGIRKYCWNAEKTMFVDYDFVDKKQSTVRTLAGTYPLFFHIATDEMAAGVASVLEKDFLMPGGLVTSLNPTGEQWDSPNGWAPLEWMAYHGLTNYNKTELADEVASRWLRQNQRVYKKTGRMMEKYNVMDTTLTAGGGEYPNQDGFGWTNGICLKLLAQH